MLCAVAADAATTRNDDSCDIAVMPAATLLLPYFVVDVGSPAAGAKTTVFTVINTSREPRIARVTLWTDLAFPVLNFNLFLTGYDAQAINLYDVLARGTVPQTLSGECEAGGPIPSNVLDEVRGALTVGRVTNCGSGAIGFTHFVDAIGYATIDVVNSCDAVFPTSERYYDELLYDNVLTGDYEIVDRNPIAGNLAAGSPLVHIRAIPDGGPAGLVTRTSLPYTFYDRYTPRTYGGSATMDRRQPLPSVFAARFIESEAGGLDTSFQIWREGVTNGSASCRDYYDRNYHYLQMKLTDSERFDEHENPSGLRCRALCPAPYPHLPPTSTVPSSYALFPLLSVSGGIGGWIYLNLDNGGSGTYSSARHSQNWVVVTMSAEGRYSTAYDATALANGCTPAPAAGATIGPGPNSTP